MIESLHKIDDNRILLPRTINANLKPAEEKPRNYRDYADNLRYRCELFKIYVQHYYLLLVDQPVAGT